MADQSIDDYTKIKGISRAKLAGYLQIDRQGLRAFELQKNGPHLVRTNIDGTISLVRSEKVLKTSSEAVS